MINCIILLNGLLAFSACTNEVSSSDNFTDVYVANFSSSDKNCRPSDVNLNHFEAKQFFVRAKQVTFKIIHDYYDWAPCYIEGSMRYKKTACVWQIRAGATGHIKCGEETWYYACDTCYDLFE